MVVLATQEIRSHRAHGVSPHASRNPITLFASDDAFASACIRYIRSIACGVIHYVHGVRESPD